MPALHDYLDLRFAVSDLVGSREISDVMPRIVQMAEVELNRQLRTQWQIEEATLTFIDGAAALPDDFLQLVESDGRVRVVNGYIYRKPHYTQPNAVLYYAKIPTITTSPSGSNWLLEQFPDAYLFASAYQAAKHLANAELAAGMDQALRAELQKIRIDDERARYSNSVVRVRGVSP